jgi:Carboxypeptidase regulatory-like domain
MKRRGSILVLPALLLLLFASNSIAQSLQVGTIEGRVVDQSGAIVPGVTVTLTSPILLSPRSAVTDAAGAYGFPSLPLGEYTVTFELSGFRKVAHTGLTVTAARTITVDATLQPGEMSETLTVIGEAPTVDVTNTNIATSIDAKALQTIPTARDVWAILQNLAPQVVLDREDVGGSQGGLQAVFSAFGSTWHQNTYALNGVNVTDPAASGAAGFYYDYDSFQETQVSTAQHSAEIGSPGVYYNIIVKSGADKYQGGSAYYFENNGLVANNLTSALTDQGVASGSSINLFSDWTGQLGGPLARDKVRFFTSWRDWRIHRNVVDFPKSENTDMFSGLGNVTYELNPSNRITGLYTRQTYFKPNRNASALVPPESTWIEDDVFSIYQGAYNSQISSNAIFDARVSYSTVVFPLKLQPGVTQPNVVELSTGKNSGAASQNYDQWRTRLAVDTAMTYVKRTGNVNHDIKGGYQYFRGLADATQDVFQGINLNVLNSVPQTVTEYNSPVQEKEIFRGSVLHLQDNVGFGRVTLNLGLRYEHTNGLLPEQGAPGGPFSVARSFAEESVFTWNSLAPRVGIIFDPLPTHTLAVKAGYARYYHAASTGFVSGPNQNNLGGSTFNWVDRNGDRQFQRGEEGTKISSFGGSITAVDASLKQPFTDELSAGVELEAPGRVRVSGMYVHRRAKDLLAIVETAVPFDSGYVPVSAIDPVTNSRVTLFNERPQFLGVDAQLVTNPSDFKTTFNGFELSAQRRFAQGYQFLTSYAFSKSDITRTSISVSQYGGEEEGAGGVGFGSSAFLNPNQLINNTSGPGFYDRTHAFKVGGSYDVQRFRVTLAATGKIQTGTPFGRILTLSEDAGGNAFNQGPITFFAEPRDANRFPTLKTMDFRIAKYFIVGRQRFEAIGDFFNLFNVSTITNVNPNSGSDFSKPTDILGPRVFRLGGRWTF